MSTVVPHPTPASVTPTPVLARQDLDGSAGDRYAFTARDILRESLTPLLFGNQSKRAAESIEIMPGDEPKPNCGQVFLGLRSTETRLQGPEYTIVEVKVLVAVTLRTADIPYDRQGRIAYQESSLLTKSPYQALSVVRESIDKALTHNPEVFVRTNRQDRFVNDPPLLTPLWLEQEDDVRDVGPEHFWVPDDNDPNSRQQLGVFQLLMFGGGLQNRNRFLNGPR